MGTQKKTTAKKEELLAEDGEKKTTPKKTVQRTKNCKKYARQRVAEEWPAIVKNLVTKAKTGSYNHTKLLVEVSGIKDDEVKPARRKRSGLTKILLKKLSEKEAERE